MLRSMLVIFLLTVSINASALQTLVNKPQGIAKGLVIIAPAKKYLMQERLFSSLAQSLASRGFLTVRFNWSADTLQTQELELQKAARDIQNVILNAQRAFGFQANQTTLISKSFSTKALDPSLSLAKNHVLLTPNCSPESPFQKTYWNILNKSGIRLKMIISIDDPYCNVKEIYQTLNAIGKPQLIATTKGDHNFVVTEPSTNNLFYGFQDLVVRYVVDLVGVIPAAASIDPLKKHESAK
ncbi:MAG: hypothetical protein AABY64_02440 [Bdellovibrionota bacterium]